MSTPNRPLTQALDGQIIVGIQKDLHAVTSMAFGGQTYTPTSLVAFFQSRIDAANAVVTARAQWQDAVQKYKLIHATGQVVTRGLKQYVMGTYGETSPVIADFGFTPPKRVSQTPEQKAAAVAKRAATRQARHTVGKKVKLAIKGTVAPAPTNPAAPANPVAAAVPPASAPLTPSLAAAPVVTPTAAVTALARPAT